MTNNTHHGAITEAIEALEDAINTYQSVNGILETNLTPIMQTQALTKLQALKDVVPDTLEYRYEKEYHQKLYERAKLLHEAMEEK